MAVVMVTLVNVYHRGGEVWKNVHIVQKKYNMQQSAMMRFKLDYEAWTGNPVELAVAERN